MVDFQIADLLIFFSGANPQITILELIQLLIVYHCMGVKSTALFAQESWVGNFTGNVSRFF